MNKPHKHAELIKAWADGATIECNSNTGGTGYWQPCHQPLWHDYCVYRVKPREFPKSGLSNKKIYTAYYETPPADGFEDTPIVRSFMTLLRRVADEAVKQYILDTENQK